MFDFSKGDPFENTHVEDFHKEKGGKLSFHGTTGTQEMQVYDKFMQGSRKRLEEANQNGGWIDKSTHTAYDNHIDTFTDKMKALHNNLNRVPVVLLI